MKIYAYCEQGRDYPFIFTSTHIIKNYYPWWCTAMKKVNKEHLINEETCIEDFLVVNWAWEIKTPEFNAAGFLVNREDWTKDIMLAIAFREGIEMTTKVEEYVTLARKLFIENGTVPALREFSKMTGGDRKGSHFNKIFHGGTMKKIAMLGGLPQPTGCV